MKKAQNKFNELVGIISHLRKKCAWKKALTLHDVPEYSKSEFDELMQAVEKEDWENLREELGDVLFHILLYAEIAKEQGKFDIDDVIQESIEKMKRRNPHIYGTVKATTPEEIEKMWQEVKRKEKLEKAKELEKIKKKQRKK